MTALSLWYNLCTCWKDGPYIGVQVVKDQMFHPCSTFVYRLLKTPCYLFANQEVISLL